MEGMWRTSICRQISAVMIRISCSSTTMTATMAITRVPAMAPTAEPDAEDHADGSGDAHRGLDEQADEDQGHAAVAALEAVEHRPETAQHETVARKDPANVGPAPEADEQRPDEQGQKVLHDLHQAQLRKAQITEEPAEVGKPGVAPAQLRQVPLEHIAGGYPPGADAAADVGDKSREQQQKPVEDHSLSPFCRITMRTGVPSRPKTERIWFSR